LWTAAIAVLGAVALSAVLALCCKRLRSRRVTVEPARRNSTSSFSRPTAPQLQENIYEEVIELVRVGVQGEEAPSPNYENVATVGWEYGRVNVDVGEGVVGFANMTYG
jgi:hypothetical protein